MVLLRLVLGLIFSGLIGLTAQRSKALAPSGVLGAMLVGTLIVGLGGWAWGLLLVAFFTSSSLLSLYRRSDKLATSGLFAKGHRRDLGQVLANGGLGALIALVYWRSPHPALLAAFVGALAAVTSDTWATEIGVLSRQPSRLVTSGRVVPSGTSGGVTPAGSLAALAGGLFIGICAVLFVAGEQLVASQPVTLRPLWPLMPIAGVSGLIGAFADSLLGATVQGIFYCETCAHETEQVVHRCGTRSRPLRGWAWLNNDLVNLLSSGVGAMTAIGVLLCFV